MGLEKEGNTMDVPLYPLLEMTSFWKTYDECDIRGRRISQTRRNFGFRQTITKAIFFIYLFFSIVYPSFYNYSRLINGAGRLKSTPFTTNNSAPVQSIYVRKCPIWAHCFEVRRPNGHRRKKIVGRKVCRLH